MTEAKLTGTRIRAGIWEGLLTGQASAPRLEVLHLESVIDGLRVTGIAGATGQWTVQFPIPVQCLNEGVQTFVVRDTEIAATLAHFTIIAGMAMGDDIRAEIDLLRAELDLLKRAFRRHCVETAG